METPQQQGHDKERDAYRWRLQLGQIEQTLLRNGVQSEIAHGTAGSQSISFAFREKLASGVEQLRAVAAELKKALLVDDVSVQQSDGFLQVRVGSPAAAAVPLFELLDYLPDLKSATAVLGLAEDGRVITHDLADRNSPHMLVLGDRASGKTALLRSMAVSLALGSKQSEAQFVAICPTDADRERQQVQEGAWKPLNYLPHMLCDVAFRQTEIRELLLFLVGEMAHREKHRFDHPHIIVFVEQLEVVLQRGGAEAAKAVHELVQRGEETGIHLIATSRTLDAAVFGPHLLSGIPARVLGRFAEPVDGAQFGFPELVEPAALLGEGDFVAASPDLRRFQAAFVDDYDLHMALTALYAPQKRLLAQPRSRRVHMAAPAKPLGQTHIVMSGGSMLAAD